jgi:hypothetical protein
MNKRTKTLPPNYVWDDLKKRHLPFSHDRMGNFELEVRNVQLGDPEVLDAVVEVIKDKNPKGFIFKTTTGENAENKDRYVQNWDKRLVLHRENGRVTMIQTIMLALLGRQLNFLSFPAFYNADLGTHKFFHQPALFGQSHKVYFPKYSSLLSEDDFELLQDIKVKRLELAVDWPDVYNGLYHLAIPRYFPNVCCVLKMTIYVGGRDTNMDQIPAVLKEINEKTKHIKEEKSITVVEAETGKRY